MPTHLLSSRATDYLVHVPRSPGPPTSSNTDGKGLLQTGKPAKTYFLLKRCGTGACSWGAHCTLITLRASGFIFSIFHPSASNPICYQPIWCQSNWQPPFICGHFNLAAASLHSRGPAAPLLASFSSNGNASRELLDLFGMVGRKMLRCHWLDRCFYEEKRKQIWNVIGQMLVVIWNEWQ